MAWQLAVHASKRRVAPARCRTRFRVRGYALSGGLRTHWVCLEKFPLCVQFTSHSPFASLLGAIPVSFPPFGSPFTVPDDQDGPAPSVQANTAATAHSNTTIHRATRGPTPRGTRSASSPWPFTRSSQRKATTAPSRIQSRLMATGISHNTGMSKLTNRPAAVLHNPVKQHASMATNTADSAHTTNTSPGVLPRRIWRPRPKRDSSAIAATRHATTARTEKYSPDMRQPSTPRHCYCL